MHNFRSTLLSEFRVTAAIPHRRQRTPMRMFRAFAFSAVVLAATLSGCAGSPSSNSPSHGGTVTFAEQPGNTPNWIFPFVSSAYYTYLQDFQFDYSMWRPAYFLGSPTSPELDYSKSLAEPPKYSDNNSVVTVTLKPYKWSDGTPITARNLLFWFNMLRAEKVNWYGYVPGLFPDNVKSVAIVSQRTIKFTLTGPVNPMQFSQDQISNLVPIPMAWDRTSLSGPRGTGAKVPQGTGAGLDMTRKGVQAVYKFLISQNNSPKTWATNWLWQIVDGPFKLQDYQVSGRATLVANHAYSGTKPKISRLVFVPFASETAETNLLRSGNSIDVGYLPFADVAQQSALNAAGYKLSPWPIFAITYMWPNYNNPTVGPIFKQLAVRQAMQLLVDQNTMIKGIYHGYGSPTFGQVPLTASSPYATSYVKSLPYSYDPSRAVKILKSNGWAVHPGGVTTCARPGTAAGECGAGISAGQRLEFTDIYDADVPEATVQKQLDKTNFEKAGIVLNLRPVNLTQLFSETGPCTSSQSLCSWQLVDFPPATTFGYPFQGAFFQTGGTYNWGNYSNSAVDALINKLNTLPSGAQLDATQNKYANLVASDLPAIGEPTIPYQLTEVRSNLVGVTPQSPQIGIFPEDWHFTSK